MSMNFIEGLPILYEFNTIYVVVDKYTKYGHFMTLKHPYMAVSVAQVFLDYFFKLHGFPNRIVSDRDLVFLSSFWKELFALQGTP